MLRLKNQLKKAHELQNNSFILPGVRHSLIFSAIRGGAFFSTKAAKIGHWLYRLLALEKCNSKSESNYKKEKRPKEVINKNS